MNTRKTLNINENGHLAIGGCDTVELVKNYGSPLYVMDLDYMTSICKGYTDVIEHDYNNHGLVCYASKALSCTAIYTIVGGLGLGADVVSGGELYTAIKAGMSADKLFFHGNNKLPAELRMAVECGIGCIVIDSFYEIELLNKMCAELGRTQKVIIRVNPGIEAHTHHFIQTTRVDSKFGFSSADGTALDAIRLINDASNLKFEGLHCHIGSQIFELQPFEMAVDRMTDFIVKIKKELNVEIELLNLGGGFGITYTAIDKPLAPAQYVEAIVKTLNRNISEKHIKKPFLVLEPGRSIVGEAGITLYTVGAIKNIPSIKKYISVDGGMFENPRYALYEAKYEAVLASRATERATETVTVAGKCCESGDMLVVDAELPQAVSGDILAVLSTGAYNYSMASNYNRNLVPPMVLVSGGQSDYMVKPQTYEDLVARDVIPCFLKGSAKNKGAK